MVIAFKVSTLAVKKGDPGFKHALERRKKMKKSTAGCSVLDEILGGRVETGGHHRAHRRVRRGEDSDLLHPQRHGSEARGGARPGGQGLQARCLGGHIQGSIYETVESGIGEEGEESGPEERLYLASVQVCDADAPAGARWLQWLIQRSHDHPPYASEDKGWASLAGTGAEGAEEV